MGQVPVLTSNSTAYLIVGNGRVAHHLRHYLSLEKIPFRTWVRNDGRDRLLALSHECSQVALAIGDSAIEPFLSENAFLEEKSCFHLSGALSLKQIPSAHPLMTFSTALYDLETYRRIPFILEKGRGSREELLPSLQNPVFAITAEKKALYHAFCVLSGNFTVLLWEKTFAAFEAQLGLPKAVALPYLEQIARNLTTSEPNESVLTGPLARGDQGTIERHLLELKGDPFAEVYRAFVNAYQRGAP